MKTRYPYLFLIAIASLLPRSAVASVISWNVSLNTTPLIGNAAGPFSLELQFTDGSGLGDGNNAVTASGLALGGGALVGAPITFGSATGSLPGSVALSDTFFFNQYIQAFTPGTALSFTLSLSNNVDAGGAPDEFSFAILDRSGSEIPSQGAADALLLVDIDSPNPTPRSFASDTSRSTASGEPIALTAATVTLAAVPEPSPIALLAAGLVMLAMARFGGGLSAARFRTARAFRSAALLPACRTEAHVRASDDFGPPMNADERR